MIQYLTQLDQNILLWIQDHIRNDILTPIFTFITHLGDKGSIWIVLALLLLIPKKTRKVGFASLLALLFSLIVNNGIIKNLVARPRPYTVIDGLQRIIEAQKDFSFPSGHTASSFAAATVMYRELPKRYGIPAILFACLMAFSRLYVGVHYPSDVLAAVVSGVLLGILAGWVTNKVFAKIFHNHF